MQPLPRLVLLEPDAQGRISGGYLYNAKLDTATPALERVVSAAHELASHLPRDASVVLLDSLFLETASLAPLFALREQLGCLLGCVVHALPSFIARAEGGAAESAHEPWSPSAEEQHLLAQLDLVIAPGPYVPELLRRANIATPTLTCLPGFERRAMAARTLPATPARLLSVATLTRNKGHLDAARALASVRDWPWHWRIIGAPDTDPAYSAELQSTLAELGLRERVTFVGSLRAAEIWAELEATDVLLHPSYTENQPLIVMEALAAAVPVVGYRVGGMRHLVEATGAGLLVPSLDHLALGAALRAFLAQPELYTAASHAAYSAAESWPSWSASGAKLTTDLAALVATRPRR